MKLNNYLTTIILAVSLFLVFEFNSFNTISTKLETLLPSGEKKELLNKFNAFSSSKQIFLAVKGFDTSSLKKIKQLEKEFLKIDGISIKKTTTNKQLKKYLIDYKFYLNEINTTTINNLDIQNKISTLKNNILNANFLFIYDKSDPLGILEKKESQNRFIKKDHLILKDYGYLTILSLDKKIDSMDKYEEIYDSINKLQLDDIKLFSPIFYFVENSRIIKSDVNKIVIISTFLLLVLYIIILRNIKLLFNTLNTLLSSILLSLFSISLIFDSISIFVLVFGISISTVSIDYMFHNYINDYYEKKKGINKDVFFGMITTIGAFFFISFISFDLIKQICYFTIISLFFSYIQFTFLYKNINFNKIDKLKITNINYFSKLKPIHAIFISLFLILISMSNLNFDLNLKNLDVDNKKLKQEEIFFNTKLTNEKNISVLIKAKSIDELINTNVILKEKYPKAYIPFSILLTQEEYTKKQKEFKKLNMEKLKSDLESISSKEGFKSNFFNLAYNININKPTYSNKYIKSLGLEIFTYKNEFYTYAILPIDYKKNSMISKNIIEINIKNLFEEKLFLVYDELINYGLLSLSFIFIMLLLATKQNYLIAISFILFPMSMILTLANFIDFNILHLFMLFIILAISIDFGIYMSSKNLTINSIKAIIYSLLSTFAGFGVLIFSNIPALLSIGIIATIGILSIIILLLILKRPLNDTQSI